MGTDILVNWVNHFQQSSIYREYLVNLPEGLNNPYFLLLIIMGIIIFLLISVKNWIMTIILNSRNRKRQEAFRKRQDEMNRVQFAEQKMESKHEKTNGEMREIKPSDTSKPSKAPSRTISNAQLLSREEGLYIKEAERLEKPQMMQEVEQYRARIDCLPIVEELRKEEKEEDQSSDLTEILTGIENKRENERVLRSFDERNNATKKHNIEVLDQTLKKNLRVEKKE